MGQVSKQMMQQDFIKMIMDVVSRVIGDLIVTIHVYRLYRIHHIQNKIIFIKTHQTLYLTALHC